MGTLAEPTLLGAAVHLFEHVGHHAKQGNDETAKSEEETNGLP